MTTLSYLPQIGQRFREEEETEALEIALNDAVRMVEGRILTKKQQRLVDAAAQRLWSA